MPKISACIISFNEEKKIEDCLKSVRPVVDEIIVIDSNSSDKTVEIAKKYTERVYLQDFLGHVEQKNLAVSRSTNEWVLALDCDERLSPELQQSILRIKDNLARFDAYRVSRKTFYVYRWLNYIWRPDKKVRLFNKNKARWGGINPHDSVFVDSDLIQDLRGDLLHLSFDSLSAHLQTIDSFTEIGAREIMKKGKRVSLFTPFLHASWTFTRMYILKLGFLDGFAGLAASLLSWVHVFVKYSKVITWRRKGADH
ncbi:glycosyltransferase family 2 protein [candidate division KSB1 bacterium]|nr:glycosyltransferase family 2 protein [candidate division KSB1 bacterium]RQW00205.1 MAG: glycosyltransferase family 2 protein [candidate division KSB1 bacterium]